MTEELRWRASSDCNHNGVGRECKRRTGEAVWGCTGGRCGSIVLLGAALWAIDRPRGGTARLESIG